MKFDVKGLIALIIVVTLCATVILAVIGAVITGRTLTEYSAHALSSICGALIGVLATYFGGKMPSSGE